MAKLFERISKKQQGNDFKLLTYRVRYRLGEEEDEPEDLKYEQNGKGNLYGKKGRESRKGGGNSKKLKQGNYQS
jgi:hypothetical protein